MKIQHGIPLLLLAGFALAQEGGDQADPEQNAGKGTEKSTQKVAVRVESGGGNALTAKDLESKVATFVDDLLAAKDPAERQAIARKLTDLVLAQTLRGRVVDAGGRFVADAVTTVSMLPRQGGETIKGSWADGERSASWTLTKEEGDRYRLTAKVSATDGTSEQNVSDEGTLAELTRRHSFLEGTSFFGVLEGADRVQFTHSPAPRRDTVSEADLGLELAEATDDLRHQFWLPVGVGWVVRSVAPGSPAARAGLEPFDLITKVGDAWLEHAESLRDPERRAVTLTVLRRGKERQIELAQGD